MAVFSLLFGDFELVRDIRNNSDKLSCAFCLVLYPSKYLRVMKLRDINFNARSRPVGSCRWSNLWLELAQHGVDPALTALFQRRFIDQNFL